ncbi:MAG: response regulator [Candidatus Omnitrophica bacterium]|nr:response regulator [Candidatus Omnitrophota bacterium]
MINFLLVNSKLSSFSEMNDYFNEKNDISIDAASSGEDAFKIINSKKIDLIIADNQLSDMSGIEFVKKCITINFMLNCVLTGTKSPEQFHEDTEGLGILMQIPPKPGKDDSEKLLQYFNKIQKDILNLKK